MPDTYNHILAKSSRNGDVSLIKHLRDVALLAQSVAKKLGLDAGIAYKGAILHDIGKSSPIFQNTLKPTFQRPPGFIFRHEIASLFFLSLLPENEQSSVLDMIVAHHKSVYHDSKGMGILDLDENINNCFERHSEGFEIWSKDALGILKSLGLAIHPVSLKEAEENYYKAIDYCDKKSYGYSIWKGVLMAADHLASAMENDVEKVNNKLFITPDLTFYERTHELYPLSKISTEDCRKHTIVTAPTGAGKTDFLIRRCKGRVFYTLPFQASINAIYDRIKNDLQTTNTEVHLLHAASSLKLENGQLEEKIMQRHIGASVKVLTPHQIASIVFGTKGYEAMVADLQSCDIILDEIHTYSETMQAIVLKIVEILITLNCRIHIGTATMPTVLYKKLLAILGGRDTVYEVSLPDYILDTFDRHIIHKASSFDDVKEVMNKAIQDKQKILIVCNRVKRVQNLYEEIAEQYPDINKMLIHSRYKRQQRNELENSLKNVFNESKEACIVVSTQVLEVSLDISFDLMITECAPIDALIQRFGRINRKRTAHTIGHYKPIYILPPPAEKSEALPYDLDVLKRSFEILPDGELLKERNLQYLIDKVYPEMQTINIDLNTVFKEGGWKIKELWHHPKSALLETLDIDSITCIEEVDAEKYETATYSEQAKMEIPVSYRSIGYNNLDKLKTGSHPFVIPSKAYSTELGLLIEYARQQHYDVTQRFL